MVLERDVLAVEEPLELRIGTDLDTAEPVSVLMRTPGDDDELVLGFLVGEGLLHPRDDSLPEVVNGDGAISVIFAEGEMPDIGSLQRNFYSTSSCGICGKASIDAVMQLIPPAAAVEEFRLDGSRISELCEEMRSRQSLFEATGAVHAAGLFDSDGMLVLVREDVGRHNAMDKAIGAALRAELLGSTIGGVCVSGRAGFELLQKAAMSGIGILISVGAPTSLSVEFAAANSMTLVGFVSSEAYNIYTGNHRIS